MTDIIHITYVGDGGTGKHLKELMQLHPSHQHTIAQWNNVLEKTASMHPCLLHIHTIWCNGGSVWCGNGEDEQYYNIMKTFSDRNVPIFVTVHDYQWVYPYDPNIMQERMTVLPSPLHVDVATNIFNHASLVLFPTERLRQNIMLHLKDVEKGSTVVVPHCDIPVRMQQIRINDIDPQDKTINVAYIGYCVPHKGSHIFAHMASNLIGIGDNRFRYHMYGGRFGFQHPNITMHDEYIDDQLIEQLHRDKIHVICLLTTAEETYCYTLSRAINSGIPIVYLNRGAFVNRMFPSAQPRFFCADKPEDVLMLTAKAGLFVIQNQKRCDYITMPEQAVANEWYANNYPVLAPSPKLPIKIFNVWHHRLFKDLLSDVPADERSAVVLYGVNQKYPKEYDDSLTAFPMVYEYHLPFYDPIWQDRNYCQTSCFMHVFHNKYLYDGADYIGFMQYDMKVAPDALQTIRDELSVSQSRGQDVVFYENTVPLRVALSEVPCLATHALQHYNVFFGTAYTIEGIINDARCQLLPVVHTYVMRVTTFQRMMEWMTVYLKEVEAMAPNYPFSYISQAEYAERVHGLFLALETLRHDIQFRCLKGLIDHIWPHYHNQVEFDRYKKLA